MMSTLFAPFMQAQGRGAQASSIAHAASKLKSAAVHVTLEAEASIRSVVKGCPLSWAKLDGPARLVTANDIQDICLKLFGLGFAAPQIERALLALVEYQIAYETALEWLCINTDTADLPESLRNSGAGRVSAKDVAVLARASQTSASRPPDTDALIPGVEQAKGQFKAQAKVTGQQKDLSTADKQAERQGHNAWILEYMEQDSISDGEGNKDEDADIEDWEVWGDPREIERRKDERRKAKIPAEVRKQQVASEWRQAKEMALAAKTAGDKARQKDAGMMIRDLKLEMKQLGIEEESLEAETHGISADLPNPTTPTAILTAAAPDLAELGGPGSEDKGVQELAPQEAAAQEVESDGEEGMMGFFDEAEMADFLDAPAPKMAEPALPSRDAVGVKPARGKSRKLKGSIVNPSSFTKRQGSRCRSSQASNMAINKWGDPKQPEASVAPRTLLQQLCHKAQRPVPRYQKRAPGGNRLPAAGIRYAVEVGAPERKRPGKRPPKPEVFCLREDDDGWPSIQDAKNAAATLALLYLQLTQDAEVFTQLAAEYQALWLSWQESSASKLLDPTEGDTGFKDLAEQLADKQAVFLKGMQQTGSSAQPSSQDVHNKDAHSIIRQERAELWDPRGLQERLRAFRESVNGQAWMQKRQQLPVWAIKEPLAAAMQAHDVVVVSGDTGCGKTTQVPQFLLDQCIESGRPANVICTQPRRIAAISVAERVCQEREEPSPGRPGGLVGYHVRLDAASTPHTRLLFCTTGILLRRLTSDPQLHSVSHVVVDEVHERSMQGDFLMALLKEIVGKRRSTGNPLKVILMSATLDSDLFSQYFGECPVLTAGGRTFPVEQAFLEDIYELTSYKLDGQGPAALQLNGSDRGRRKALEKAAGTKKAVAKAGWGDEDGHATNKFFQPEAYMEYSLSTRRNLSRLNEFVIDYDLLDELVNFLSDTEEQGAILIFMPGAGEIAKLCEQLRSHASNREGSRWVVPLHSSISSDEQRKAFQVPPSGVRKIVVATNIAETSLTIPDVTLVIDSGKLKEKRFDVSRGMGLLVEDFISRANGLQRKGRAGRVRPGKSYCLYTRHRFDNLMRGFQVPEMSRVDLAELVLQIHLLGLGEAAAFLQTVIEPPPQRSVQAAIAQLLSAGALTPGGQLTPLGKQLAHLPLDARVGKLLVLSCCFACLAPCLTVAACLSFKPPFSASPDQQDAVQKIKMAFSSAGKRGLAAGQQSDHLVMVEAYNGWRNALHKGGRREAASYARANALNTQTLEMLADMRSQFASMLMEAGLIQCKQGSRDKSFMDDPGAPWNSCAEEASMIKLALAGAVHPHTAVMDDSPGRGARPGWTDGVAEVHVHPSSVNHSLTASQMLRPYLVYLEKMRTSRAFLVDCTAVSPAALCLAGKDICANHEEGYVMLDGWIRVKAPCVHLVLLKALQSALDTMIAAHIASAQVQSPAQSILSALRQLFAGDDVSLALH